MTEPARVNYALAIDSAALHVALALDKAAPAALSFEELAKGYSHPVPSDLTRVRRHERLADDHAAIDWMMRYVVAHFGKSVEVVDDLVIIANGHRFEDLRFRGEKMRRPGPDPYAQFRDPFNPMTGAFSDNIRSAEKDDLTELTESMKTWGWIPECPALVDERGVVLVGHRRMEVAKELGITPVIKVMTFGLGDAADAERLKLAIGTNMGGKKLSPTDRAHIANYLYQNKDWTMERIAEALKVTAMTVSRDLREFNIMLKSKRGKPRKEKVTKAPDEEQIQRSVNTRPGEWEQFKEKAKTEGYTVAAKLGELVRQDIHSDAEHLCTCPHCGHQHEKVPGSQGFGSEGNQEPGL